MIDAEEKEKKYSGYAESPIGVSDIKKDERKQKVAEKVDELKDNK